jgi:cyclic-di-AMP phosphodiesterase PgpH
LNGDELGLRGHLARAALAPLVAAAMALAFPATDAWGAIGLDILVVGLFGFVLYLFRPEIYRSLRAMIFFAAGFGVVAISAGLVARQSPPPTELIPVALPVFGFAVLFDGRIAAVAAMALAVLVGGQPALAGTSALAFCFVGGVGAALSVGRIRSRTQAYGFILAVAAIYAVAAAVSGAVSRAPWSAIVHSAALGGVNALLSAALAMLLLPLAESFTHETTDLRLLELSDPNRPLLRRLATEASGTWAHSLALANLGEAACNAIGANGLLARVGCYYHDIGKLRNPAFFHENLRGGWNPHDGMRPEQSAGIIRRHVEDGIELARQHRLPDPVTRFIPEHHGTLEITYFAEQVRTADPTAPVPDEVFRYPGPLPQTAETAVTLLADGVEAALRALDDPAADTITDAVTHLVRQRVAAGQLAESPLTLRQIEVVRRAFIHVLSGVYHNRIAYPEDAGGITADWEAPRGAA